jgi:hypothetical protein
MQIYPNFLDPALGEPAEIPHQDRLATDFKERLGHGTRQRRYTSALARGQHHRFARHSIHDAVMKNIRRLSCFGRVRQAAFTTLS